MAYPENTVLDMKRTTKRALTAAILAAVFGVMFLLKRQVQTPGSEEPRIIGEETSYGASEEGQEETESASESAKSEPVLVVYVSGAVKDPGVYELTPGSRVRDALLLAGGFTGKAEENLVNLAETVTDGEMIFFPERGAQGGPEAVLSDGRVSLNSATLEDLMTLPGIGEAKASAILEYREAHGSFQEIEELLQVSGIGESLFERLKDKVKL